MSARILRFAITAQPTSAARSRQTRTPGSALLAEELRGLTQEQAAALIGRDSRQIRKWLRKAPPVLELLAALRAQGRRAA
jgi:hypothetical protein